VDSQDYFFELFTAALSVAPALNDGTLEALIFNSAPVLGLRPVRAARFFTEKAPNPTNDRESPFLRVFEMISMKAAIVRSAAALLVSVFFARASASSLRFIVLPFIKFN